MPPRRKRILWTPTDVKTLRRLAGRQSVKAIARQLKRSEPAVRFKAHVHGIRLSTQ